MSEITQSTSAPAQARSVSSNESGGRFVSSSRNVLSNRGSTAFLGPLLATKGTRCHPAITTINC